MPKDPWRVINGVTTIAKGSNWFQFIGKVSEVQPNGILIEGLVGLPLESKSNYVSGEFFIAHFPYKLADNEQISPASRCVAYYGSDTYTYTNTYHTFRGGIHTVRKFDYGAVTNPAPVIVDGLDLERVKLMKKQVKYFSEQSRLDNELVELEGKVNRQQEEFENKTRPIAAKYEAKLNENQIAFAQKLKGGANPD